MVDSNKFFARLWYIVFCQWKVKDWFGKELFPGCDGEKELTGFQVYQIFQQLALDALEHWLTMEKLRKANNKLATKGELIKFKDI